MPYYYLFLNSGLLSLTSLSAADRVKLHHLLSGSAERKKDELESLRQHYKSYKESYIKNTQFDPEKNNLS